MKHRKSGQSVLHEYDRSSLGNVPFEAVGVKLRVTDTSYTYAIEMKDSSMIEDRIADECGKALRKEKMMNESIRRSVNRIMMLRKRGMSMCASPYFI